MAHLMTFVATGELAGSSQVRADFSLHLSILDLDYLTREIRSRVGQGPASFFESLDGAADVDSRADSGNSRISHEWVTMVAALEDSRVVELVHGWLGEHPDAVRAVRDLITVCRTAASDDLVVTFGWSL